DGILLNLATDMKKDPLNIPELLMLTRIVITQGIEETTQRNVDVEELLATELRDLLSFNIDNQWYERCRGCQKKDREYTLEREELYELRKFQIEKRERTQSSEPEETTTTKKKNQVKKKSTGPRLRRRNNKESKL
ncbi:25358_t:CDS:2, partial [Dentiscutata erythropus]